MTNNLTLTIEAADRGNPLWPSLAETLESEISNPSSVELIVTDRFDSVAGELATRSPVRANPDMTAADYRAAKGDGSMADARTVPLPDARAAVVLNARFARSDETKARHTIIHEAQHVTMHQYGDSAYGVHRRTAFELPTDKIHWEFMWMAESAVDEFRCERVMHQRGMGTAWHDYPNGWPPIVAMFDTARAVCRRTGDINRCYRDVFAALERAANFLAYGAASIVTGPVELQTWSSVPAMAEVIDLFSPIPAADEVTTDEDLTSFAFDLGVALRRILRANGVDLRATADDGRHLDLLR